jgi:predicted GNAT family N-acyltransferase
MIEMSKLEGLSDKQRGNLREITKVQTRPDRRRMGDAKWLMCEVCVEADLAEKVLMLTIAPFADEPMDAMALEMFYRSFGFKTLQREADDGTPTVIMARAPR